MITCILYALLLQAPVPMEEVSAQDLTKLDFGKPFEHMAIASLDGTLVGQMLAIDGRKVRLLEQEDAPTLELPGEATLWTMADLDGNGLEEFWVLVDGKELRRLELKEGVFSLSDPIIGGLRGVPPRGCHSGSFLRDLDKDGHPDLLLPMGDRLQLWMGDGSSFQEGPDLGSISRLELRTDGGLLGKVGRKIVVPQLLPEDISGDGRPDITVSDGLQIRQFVLGPDGFPSEPTRSLDLSQFRADMDEFGVDLSNLTSSIRFLVQDKWADLNNDGAMDLLILADGRIRVFLGGEDGVDLARERTRLKVRGNVFYIYPARIDADDIPDLVLVRVEDLGIGKILRAALFSWEIEFDFLVFRGKGDGDFEKRPFRERSANLKGGSLVRVFKGEKDQFDSLRQKIVRMCDYDGDGIRTDLVTLGAGGRLQVWFNLVSDESVLHGAIEKFLQQTLAGDGDLDIGISTLTQWTLGRTSAMTSMTNGIEPDLDIRLENWAEPHALTIRDLDGDGREEVLAVRLLTPEEGEKSLIGYLLRF
ncbi:MAG: hypothetical protein COA70_13485 [Planctomycetota bacterium]|nr:MAG: hypothetical protein COA70_13485 [Planctomycetota bacterium]